MRTVWMRKGAEQCYRTALRSDPDHAEANYNQAKALQAEGDPENAILFYTKSIHADPEFADAHFNLARTLDKTGRTAEAERHWRRYLALEPDGEWADFDRQRLGERG